MQILNLDKSVCETETDVWFIENNIPRYVIISIRMACIVVNLKAVLCLYSIEQRGLIFSIADILICMYVYICTISYINIYTKNRAKFSRSSVVRINVYVRQQVG